MERTQSEIKAAGEEEGEVILTHSLCTKHFLQCFTYMSEVVFCRRGNRLREVESF